MYNECKRIVCENSLLKFITSAVIKMHKRILFRSTHRQLQFLKLDLRRSLFRAADSLNVASHIKNIWQRF